MKRTSLSVDSFLSKKVHAKPRVHYSTSEIHEIRKILDVILEGSWLYLDLDNTIMEACLELGSDQWFGELTKLACEQIEDHEKAAEIAVAIYHEVQDLIKTQPVESDIVKIIKQLQEKGVHVLAITARDRCLEKTTIRQLDEIGINLGEGNIIFCSGRDKGECLEETFQQMKDKGQALPKHIVNVDDKLKHIINVGLVAKYFGIHFDGFHYRFLDEKVGSFEMHRANFQLSHVKHLLRQDVQEKISMLNLPYPSTLTLQAGDHRFFGGGLTQPDESSTHESVEERASSLCK